MVIFGRTQIDDVGSIELVSESGGSGSHPVEVFRSRQDGPKIFLWLNRLTDDTYHLRCLGETNDLAVIHLRQ